jgi:hypothetical protein
VLFVGIVDGDGVVLLTSSGGGDFWWTL